ncbi:unnamed protein product, partial [Ectocarpus sp. 12 AP-2014]
MISARNKSRSTVQLSAARMATTLNCRLCRHRAPNRNSHMQAGGIRAITVLQPTCFRDYPGHTKQLIAQVQERTREHRAHCKKRKKRHDSHGTKDTLHLTAAHCFTHHAHIFP